MGMLRWFYEEIKEDWWSLKSHFEEARSSFYYGYIKHDDYSKHNFAFHLRMAWYTLWSPFRQIGIGFQNISKWWMVIWADREFDHHYLYYILRHKLRLMEEFFYSDETHIEDAAKYAAQIKECRELLDDLIDDTSYDEIMDEYHTAYPHEYTDFLNCTPSESEEERIAQGLPARWYTLNHTRLSPEEEEKRGILFKSCCERADAKKEELRKTLFENIAKNVEYWWD